MRMWMIDPRLLCQRHLLGEHYELHKLVGCLRKGRSIEGYLRKQLIDPSSIYERHIGLEYELRRRGGNPMSPLVEAECEAFARWYGAVLIDPGKSMSDLSARCEKCRLRIGNFVRVTIGKTTVYIPGERK